MVHERHERHEKLTGSGLQALVLRRERGCLKHRKNGGLQGWNVSDINHGSFDAPQKTVFDMAAFPHNLDIPLEFVFKEKGEPGQVFEAGLPELDQEVDITAAILGAGGDGMIG